MGSRTQLHKTTFTLILTAIALYPISFVPACWMFNAHLISEDSLWTGYRPISRTINFFPNTIGDPIVSVLVVCGAKDVFARLCEREISERWKRGDLSPLKD